MSARTSTREAREATVNKGNHVTFPVDVSDIFVKGVTDQQFVFKFRCIEAYAEQSSKGDGAGAERKRKGRKRSEGSEGKERTGRNGAERRLRT